MPVFKNRAPGLSGLSPEVLVLSVLILLISWLGLMSHFSLSLKNLEPTCVLGAQLMNCLG